MKGSAALLPAMLAIGVAGCGPGYEEAGDIATFASESRFGGGAIYAVDDLANEGLHSARRRAVAGLSLDDDGVEVSRGCAAG